MKSFPHVVRVIYVFELGKVATLKLAVQGLEAGATVLLYESNPKYEWTDTQAVVDGMYLTVTAIPRVDPDYVPSRRHPYPFLGGGGTGQRNP